MHLVIMIPGKRVRIEQILRALQSVSVHRYDRCINSAQSSGIPPMLWTSAGLGCVSVYHVLDLVCHEQYPM